MMKAFQFMGMVLLCSMSSFAADKDLSDEGCKDLLSHVPASVKKSILKGILADRRLPLVAGMSPEMQLALLDAQDLKKIEELLYSDYRDWVKAHKRYPPSFEEFKVSLGMNQLGAEEQAHFDALFDPRFGVFKGFEQDFIANVTARMPEYTMFF